MADRDQTRYEEQQQAYFDRQKRETERLAEKARKSAKLGDPKIVDEPTVSGSPVAKPKKPKAAKKFTTGKGGKK